MLMSSVAHTPQPKVPAKVLCYLCLPCAYLPHSPDSGLYRLFIYAEKCLLQPLYLGLLLDRKFIASCAIKATCKKGSFCSAL